MFQKFAKLAKTMFENFCK